MKRKFLLYEEFLYNLDNKHLELYELSTYFAIVYNEKTM